MLKRGQSQRIQFAVGIALFMGGVYFLIQGGTINIVIGIAMIALGAYFIFQF